MDKETQDYISELIHLKSLGLLSDAESQNLESILKLQKMMKNLEVEKNNITSTNPVLGKYEIKFVNTSKNPDPTWAKDGDSGFDLRANLPDGLKELVLKPFERFLIPTGLYFDLPNGMELQIRPRSGHSFKTGLMAILGTVDFGFRGEVKVIMINLSNEAQKIEQGERIAQGVVASRISNDFGVMVKLDSVEDLSETERGSGGFGSTGKN